MPANQYGIDLGEIYRTKAAVTGARTRNKLAGLQLEEAEYQKSKRPEREERKNVLAGLRQKGVMGDQDAVRMLIAMDPEGGQAFITAVSKMDQRQIDQAKRNVDEIGQMSAFVLEGKTPEERERRYGVVYNGVSPEVRKNLPEQFDPDFMELSLSKAIPMDKILSNPTVLKVGPEDVVYQRGREVERQTRPITKTGTGPGVGAGGRELKSTDERLMYKQAGELLGGIFDENEVLVNLDPQTRNKIQAIASEATKIYRRRGDISRTDAVKLAARKFGMTIPDAPAPGTTPPPEEKPPEQTKQGVLNDAVNKLHQLLQDR